MSFVSRIVLLSVLLLTIGPVHAGEARRHFERFVTKLNAMYASFSQTRLDARGETIEASEGEMLVARPNKFRLNYTKPYEQLYVSDGKKMWSYDKDLEQVTIKPLGKALDKSPILLLSNPKSLDKRYIVHEPGLINGLYWLELKPRDKESNFDLIRIAMDGDKLQAMEMVDGLGQSTRLYFHRITRNPKIKAGAFSFKIPAKVDVIDESK